MHHLSSIKATAMNKDRARVWVESTQLAVYGFDRHTPITIQIIEGDRIDITVDPVGARKVAGRERNGKSIQILDICMPPALRDSIRNGADKLQVWIEFGHIEIRRV